VFSDVRGGSKITGKGGLIPLGDKISFMVSSTETNFMMFSVKAGIFPVFFISSAINW